MHVEDRESDVTILYAKPQLPGKDIAVVAHFHWSQDEKVFPEILQSFRECSGVGAVQSDEGGG